MNNTSINSITPAVITKSMEIGTFLHSMIILVNTFTSILFLINFVICIIAWIKKIKQSKVLLVLCIIALGLMNFSNIHRPFMAELGPKESSFDIYDILAVTNPIVCIIAFTIQVVIFIKLIINIKNHKKEGGEPKCQE